MKTKSAIAAALALASIGLAATPQSLPQQQTQQQRNNDAVAYSPRTVRQGRPTALNPTGSMPIFIECGLTPKEYGQWLQQRGRQKWVKKSKSKRIKP